MRTFPERVAEALRTLIGEPWKVRRGHCIVTTLPSGRLFWASPEYGSMRLDARWCAYTGDGLTSDVRVAGLTSHATPRPGERAEDVAALEIASQLERALEDPRNADRRWRPISREAAAEHMRRWRAEGEAKLAAMRYLAMRGEGENSS